MQLIVAEKPSVARDLAKVLGVAPHGHGAFRGPHHVITWCIGHLVELIEPHEYEPSWKGWRMSTLPMIPAAFRLRPARGTADQWAVVRDLLRSREFDEVINACDAGREGELIFRYCYELAGSRLRVQRLWISSMTDSALRAGFAKLRPGSQLDALADAARSRSEADWLVGLNATRAFTLSQRRGAEGSALLSVGRVQTPTLALLVERERAIESFVPKDYWEVAGNFTPRTSDARDGQPNTRFVARWQVGSVARLDTASLADQVVARAATHTRPPSGPRVEKVEQKRQKEPPPLLFDLTSLQRTANRRFGMSAQHTLDVAQALYERHKLLTYPRTDSRYLSTDIRAEVPSILSALATEPTYTTFANHVRANPPGALPRVFNNAQVSDHHAIIPTTKTPQLGTLSSDERKIYDLIVRRFLGAFYPDAEFAITVLTVVVGQAVADSDATKNVSPHAEARAVTPRDGSAEKENAPEDDTVLTTLPLPPDRFVARGKVRLVAGWQEPAGMTGVTRRSADAGPDVSAEQDLPLLREGDLLHGEYTPLAKRTRPPPRYSEASLLGAMESAGKAIDDEALRIAMKDCGLGTPATRASILETLIRRGFAVRDAKNLVPTPLGRALIDRLPAPVLASAELTGSWEARLARMARGEESRATFMAEIVDLVSGIVKAIANAPIAAPLPVAATTASPPTSPTSSRSGRSQSTSRATQRGARDRERAPAAAPRSRPSTSTNTSTTAPKKPRATAAKTKTVTPGSVVDLGCPSCGSGKLITGHRAWGCSRFREGCTLVIPFEIAGRRLSDTQLRDLVERGKTRSTEWKIGDQPVTGRLHLRVSEGVVNVELVPSAAEKNRSR